MIDRAKLSRGFSPLDVTMGKHYGAFGVINPEVPEAIETKSLEPMGLDTPHRLKGKFFGFSDLDDFGRSELDQGQSGKWFCGPVVVTLSKITGNVDSYDIRETPWAASTPDKLTPDALGPDSLRDTVRQSNNAALIVKHLTLEQASGILATRYGITYPPPVPQEAPVENPIELTEDTGD